jgi:drug/metabolite transporter (DMT)-like permease
VGVIYVVAAVMLWSAVPLLIKQVAPPFDVRWVALLRLALGAGFLAVAERFIAARPRRRDRAHAPWNWPQRAWVLLGGAGLGANYLLYTAGVARTTATAANLVVQVEVILLALWGLLILRESAPPAKLAGMALAFGGVFLVAWNGESLAALVHSRYFVGNITIAAAGFGWSFYGLSQKMLLRTRGVGETVVAIMVIGAVTTVAVAAFASPVSRAPTPLEWAYLGVLGLVCTGVAYLLLARGLQLLDASSVALISTLLPLFTMVEAHLLLGERLTGFIVAGAALIVSGVGLVVVRPGARP